MLKVYTAVPLRYVKSATIKAALSEAWGTVARFCVCCGKSRRVDNGYDLMDGDAWRCMLNLCCCSDREYAFLQSKGLEYRLFRTNDRAANNDFGAFMDEYHNYNNECERLSPKWRGLDEEAYVLEDGSLILPSTLEDDGYALGLTFRDPEPWKRIFSDHRFLSVELHCEPGKSPAEVKNKPKAPAKAEEPVVVEEPVKIPARKREKGFKLDLETLIVAYLVMTH